MSRADWHVNERCINCMASRTMAPDFIKEVDGRSVFVRQPTTADEEVAAWRALLVCPTAAVEAPSGPARPRDLFPQALGEDVFRLGFNAQSSYGAHAYYTTVDGQRFMIDGPRWSSQLVSWMTQRGGLDHILLTHRDDVGDAERYAKHFGSRVWIHEGDASSAPFATDVMRGDAPTGPSPQLEIIAVPGHTLGSVMYLFDDRTLFSGDSLAWDPETASLEAYREVAWYDWATQLRSLAGLRRNTFSRLFAGHGGSVELPAEQMRAALEAMLLREGSAREL